MSKSNYYFGQSTLAQVFKLIPRPILSKAVKQSKSDFATKKCTTLNHLFSMCYTMLADVTSLRRVSDGLMAIGEKLNHLGMNYVPPKSTSSDANALRSSHVFGLIYQGLYEYYYPFLSDSSTIAALLKKAYAVDSNSISLFKAILKASGRKS